MTAGTAENTLVFYHFGKWLFLVYYHPFFLGCGLFGSFSLKVLQHGVVMCDIMGEVLFFSFNGPRVPDL